MVGDLDGAEMFFAACTDFHPLFLECWTAWYIFYVLCENAEAADMMLVLAVKTLNDLYPAFEELKTPLLSWEEVQVKSNLFLRAAIYFLRYNLYEFAEICLAKELERKGLRTLKFLYYLAVSHHLTGRYTDSINHLEEALQIDWENDLIWTLLGHNYYRLGIGEKAIEAYDFALNKISDGENCHLIYLRKGYFYLQLEKFEEAKSSFLEALDKRQTPLSWLGAGIASYSLGCMEDAEAALVESNALDPTMGLTWAYLALVNINKVNYDMYVQCITQAKKYGISVDNLLERIEEFGSKITCDDGEELVRIRKASQANFKPSVLLQLSDKLPSVIIKRPIFDEVKLIDDNTNAAAEAVALINEIPTHDT